MTAMTEAMSLVVTRNGIGRIARDSRASISSAMRIAPSCAVNRQPACIAKAREAMMGASSRVLTSDEMMPVAGPNPSRLRKLYPSTATNAPAVKPSTTATPAVPPPTTIEPLPHAMFDSNLKNSVRYCRSTIGTARTARAKKTNMCPRRMVGAAAARYAPTIGRASPGTYAEAVISQPRPGEQRVVQLTDPDVDDHQHQNRLHHRRVHRIGHTRRATLGEKPFLAGDYRDNGAVDHGLEQRDDHVLRGGERRKCRYKASRRAPLEVDIEQIAGQKADETGDSGQGDSDHDGRGESGHDQAADHRDAHDLHRVGLLAHGPRTEISGDGGADGRGHQHRGHQRGGLTDDGEPTGGAGERGRTDLVGQQGELDGQG